jgi:hypothetical protein
MPIDGVLRRRRAMKRVEYVPVATSFLLTFTFCFMVGYLSYATTEPQLAAAYFDSSGISWQPHIAYESITLTISCPDGRILEKEFGAETFPSFDTSDPGGGRLPDGQYTYELRATPVIDPEVRDAMLAARSSGDTSTLEELQREYLPSHPLVQSGTFVIGDGNLLIPGGGEELSISADLTGAPDPPQDIVHADDVIIDGSLCTGNDCYSGLAFGFDTIVMMENNLRIFFDDTSTIQNYPRNDWRLIANDSTDGGGNYFAIEDATEVSNIFVLEAGAPDNSLYVDSYGDVGVGTATPYYELHIVDGDSPAVRLDQDGSYGWTPQKWDLCGNESNFFIRDATHASKLPFRIEPDTPTDTIFMKSNGNVGIGTGSPGYAMELERTGANAAFVAQRTDGATNYINATASFGNFGTVTSHPLRLVAGGLWKMKINTDGTLDMSDGGSYNGTWNNASSREYKENIESLDADNALEVIQELRPVQYNYKSQQDERLGFIAEEVPDLVAMDDRKSLSTMDIVAVLTKVVQEQQKVILDQQKAISELSERVELLEHGPTFNETTTGGIEEQ